MCFNCEIIFKIESKLFTNSNKAGVLTYTLYLTRQQQCQEDQTGYFCGDEKKWTCLSNGINCYGENDEDRYREISSHRS